MTDYRDFMHQADADILRANKLFGEKDFGFAAYSAQQGLEKYIKAYLLRLNMFDDPQELGHLQYPQILREAAIVIDDINKSEDMKHAHEFLDAYSKFILESANVIQMFTEDKKKILIWKTSLGMSLNTEEAAIMQGINTKFTIMVQQLSISFQNIILPVLVTLKLQPVSVDSSVEQAITRFFVDLLKMMQNPEQYTTQQAFDILDGLMQSLKPFFYGTGTDSLSKSATDWILRLYFLLRTVTWLDVAQYSFPHEDIGRYPTYIDGISSITIYQDRKDNLLFLIQEITKTCCSIKKILIEMMA